MTAFARERNGSDMGLVYLIALGIGLVVCITLLGLILFSTWRQEMLIESIDLRLNNGRAGLKTVEEVCAEKGRPTGEAWKA